MASKTFDGLHPIVSYVCYDRSNDFRLCRTAILLVWKSAFRTNASPYNRSVPLMGGMKMAAISEILLEEINAKEDLSLRLGDALDVKASIGLALILFLATQSAYLLEKGLPRIGVAMQLFSIVAVVVAAIFALLELWPRTYILPQPESDYIPKRIEELTQHYGPYPDVESNVLGAFVNDEMQWAKKRIADSQRKNRSKSRRLEVSFWCTGAAVILNLLTVLLFLKMIF